MFGTDIIIRIVKTKFLRMCSFPSENSSKFKLILKMLESRGYAANEGHPKLLEDLSNGPQVFYAKSKSGGNIAVFIYDVFTLVKRRKDLGCGNLRYVKKILAEKAFDLAIVICDKTGKINYGEALRNGVQILKASEVLIDPTSSSMVPKHELLSNVERDKVAKAWRLEKLPIIQLTDPICKYYCGRPGDVFRIHRRKQLCGTEAHYRVVIDK